MGLDGLTQLNIELTSACNKSVHCTFCGHQDPAIHPKRVDGTISQALLAQVSGEVPSGVLVQFHRDGDPLAYAGSLATVGTLFNHTIRSLVTHGETLAERADEIIDHFDVVTVSIFRGDPGRDQQLASLAAFMQAKGDRQPRVLLKIVGDMTDDDLRPYLALGIPLLRRLLHLPQSNARYARGLPAMPEHGLCLDLLHHPSVAWDGRVYLCNRLDPDDRGLLGSLTTQSLAAIWNGPIRRAIVQAHLHGQRTSVQACATCQYYGIPTH